MHTTREVWEWGPRRPALPHRLTIKVHWDPEKELTHILVLADEDYDGLTYGPFEASCNCHSRYGPVALVCTALMAYWRQGPLALEIWQDEKDHDCQLPEGQHEQ